MRVSGELFIGRERVARAQTFQGVNPATGETLQPAFSAADAGDVAKACELAAAAFDAHPTNWAHVWYRIAPSRRSDLPAHVPAVLR